MLKLLQRRTKVVDPTDIVVDDIKQYINSTFKLDFTNDEIVNIISSQSYIAFNLGIKNNLDVRFPRLGAFKVNKKAKQAKQLYKLVLSECNGDSKLAAEVINNLKGKFVLQDFQV